MYNATITLYSHGKDYDDDTGYVTREAEPEVLLEAARCEFSPAGSARMTRNDAGIAQYSRTLPTALLDCDEEFDVRVGDQCDITLDGETEAKRYTIERAEKVRGIAAAEWYLELERIDVPAN